MSLQLERLRWWDIEQLVELEEIIFPGDSPWSAAMFWSELAAGHHYVVHRNSDGTIDGYAGVANNDDVSDIQNVAVHPDAQGRGIGRALFADLLAHATGDTVLLEVRTDNTPAIALYESTGFTRIGLRRGYYQPSGADAFTMQQKKKGTR